MCLWLGVRSVDLIGSSELFEVGVLDGEPYFALAACHRKQYRCTVPNGRTAELPAELTAIWITLIALSVDALWGDDTTGVAYARLQRTAAALVQTSYREHAITFAQLCEVETADDRIARVCAELDAESGDVCACGARYTDDVGSRLCPDCTESRPEDDARLRN